MSDKSATTEKHFHQEPRRRAEFIMPPNTLKAKVGGGGIGEEILSKAQELLENNAVDFQPLAEMYLGTLMNGINSARSAKADADPEPLIAAMLYPSMQLKANGGMFHYALVTTVADRLVQFLEVIIKPDADALEIVLAFQTTIRAIILSRIQGTGGRYGSELIDALDSACLRYFDRYPYNRSSDKQDFDTAF